MIKSKDKVVFIDGSNLYASARAIHLNIDYLKLLSVFSRNALRTYYFTALPPANEESKLRPLMDMIQYNGYSLITREWKKFYDPDTQELKVKGNMDIDITVEAMDLSGDIKNMVFFTGDGDFVPLLRRLQQKGVHCTVVSTLCADLTTQTTRGPQPKPSMIADELRKQADVYIDLNDPKIRASISRD